MRKDDQLLVRSLSRVRRLCHLAARPNSDIDLLEHGRVLSLTAVREGTITW